MSYKDYFEAEEPTWNVFTEEEIELGDLPKADAVAAPKKDDRQAKKNERLAARQNKGAAQAEENKKDPNDPSAALFGERELNKSQGDPELRFTKKFVKIKDINESIDGQEIIVRGRLHNSRAKGKLAFFIVREQFSTIQAILKAEDKISKGMVTYASKVPKESIIEVKAKVVKSEQPVETCSQKVELEIIEFWVINKSAPMLPFQIDDASRLVTNQAAEGIGGGDEEQKEGEDQGGAVVK